VATATVRKNEQKDDGNDKTTNKNNRCICFHLIFSVSVHKSGITDANNIIISMRAEMGKIPLKLNLDRLDK